MSDTIRRGQDIGNAMFTGTTAVAEEVRIVWTPRGYWEASLRWRPNSWEGEFKWGRWFRSWRFHRKVGK